MTLYGNYKKNEKWGMQFVVDSYEVEKPTTKEAVEELLGITLSEKQD